MNIRFLILIPFIFTGFFIDKLYFTCVLVTFCTYTIISITTSCEQVTKVATDKALPLRPHEIGRWNRKPYNFLRLACPSINNDSRCKKYQVFFYSILPRKDKEFSVRPSVRYVCKALWDFNKTNFSTLRKRKREVSFLQGVEPLCQCKNLVEPTFYCLFSPKTTTFTFTIFAIKQIV